MANADDNPPAGDRDEETAEEQEGNEEASRKETLLGLGNLDLPRPRKNTLASGRPSIAETSKKLSKISLFEEEEDHEEDLEDGGERETQALESAAGRKKTLQSIPGEGTRVDDAEESEGAVDSASERTTQALESVERKQTLRSFPGDPEPSEGAGHDDAEEGDADVSSPFRAVDEADEVGNDEIEEDEASTIASPPVPQQTHRQPEDLDAVDLSAEVELADDAGEPPGDQVNGPSESRDLVDLSAEIELADDEDVPKDDYEDFEGEATQISPTLADSEVFEEDFVGEETQIADDLVEESYDVEDDDFAFPDEKTTIAESDYDFSDDRVDDLPDEAPLPEPIPGEAERARESTRQPGTEGTPEPSGPQPPPESSAPEQQPQPEPGQVPRQQPQQPRQAQGGGMPPPEQHRGGAQAERQPEAEQDGVAYRGDPDAAELGDFEDEKTELLDSPFENDPVVAKMVVLDGPCVGQEFFVSGVRNTLGRATNNSIVVSDLAMSRQHMEVVKNPDETYTIRDLQSVNGTFLNGTRIREADLFHGDRVEAGKSAFQFVLSGAASHPARNRRVVPAAGDTMAGQNQRAQGPAPPARARSDGLSTVLTYVSVVAGVLSLLLIIGIGVLLYQKSSTTGEEAPVSTADQASAAYLEGVEAVKTREWDAARAAFERAAKLDPAMSGVASQLERIEMEEQARGTLARARELAERGERDAAAETVREIPRASVYFEEGKELLREKRKLEVDEMYARAQRAFTEENHERALRYIGSILEQVPTHTGALELRDRIEAAEETADGEDEEEQEAVAARPTTRRKSSSDDDDDWDFDLEPSSRKKSRKSSSSSSRVVNFTRGYTLYRNRRFDDAIDFFEDAGKGDSAVASRATKTAGEIESFRSAYDTANSAFQAKRWEAAQRKLKAAKRADSAVAGGKGFFHDEISEKLATTQAELGLAALSNGKYSAARKYQEAALRSDRSSAKVRELGTELKKEARALYIRAVNKKKSDPAEAARLTRAIMSMLPSSDATYRKAQELMKSL